MPGSEGMEDTRPASTIEKVAQMEYTYPIAGTPTLQSLFRQGPYPSQWHFARKKG